MQGWFSHFKSCTQGSGAIV